MDPRPLTQEFLHEKLKASNLRIRTCGSGDDALRLVQQDRFDLLVCALEMPSPNGSDLLKCMRDLGVEIPAIFLSRTATDDTLQGERVRAIGSYPVLGRPVLLNRLYEMIESTLRMKFEWRERRRHPRLPVKIRVRFPVQRPHESTIPVEATTIDVSLGGLMIERPMCTVCPGYEAGGVHPDCVLRPRALANADSTAVELELQIAPQKTLCLKARIVHTLIEEGTTREFVGLRFESMNAEDREFMRAELRKHAAPDNEDTFRHIKFKKSDEQSVNS